MGVRLEQRVIPLPEGGGFIVYGEIAVNYEIERKAFYQSECEHPRTEIRLRTVSGGGIQCRSQCLDCGASVGNAVKRTDTAPDWDEHLNPKYNTDREQELAAIYEKFIALQKRKDTELDARSKDWKAEYEAYRRTPRWQVKRSKVMIRAKGLCEGCLDAPATVVHHLSYANIGDELLFQLVALCRPCHHKAHPEHHDPIFYDNDYVPCTNCRWGGSTTCIKFDRPTYEALSADGECGPSASEFEGMK